MKQMLEPLKNSWPQEIFNFQPSIENQRLELPLNKKRNKIKRM